MSLKPLVLSVRASNGRTGGDAQGFCPFCWVRAAGRQEPLLGADGIEDLACALCHLVRHLERETIDEEAVLIWLPEMTQAAVNAMAHAAHRRLAAEGALHLAAAPFASHGSVEAGRAAAALEAIRALAARAADAEALLRTASPRLLGAALLRARPQLYADRARRLGGLRLWPQGRFFVDGDDVYPRLIASQLPCEGQVNPGGGL
jgi:hypothetical protein